MLASTGGLLATLAGPGAAADQLTASFTYSPSSPLSRQSVKFTSTSVASAVDNPITSYQWDLDGNGSLETDDDRTVSRSYPAPRTVTVTLQVTDQTGATATTSRTVTIANRYPTASFTYLPAAPVANDPITFTSTADDLDGQVTELVWDLNGDGNYDNGAGPTALRSFDRAGSYVVGLRATDNSGAISFSSQTIAVGASADPATAQQLPKGSSTLRLMDPFPLVRIMGRITRVGTRVRLLRVDAPRGAKVTVHCKGRSCPFRKRVSLARRSPSAQAAKLVRVRRLERLLRAGVIVRIFVTQQNAIGKYTRFKIRRSEAPARVDRCVAPGSWRPIRCPGA